MRISLPTHGVLELLLGLALLAMAVLLEPAGLIIGCFAGIVIVGLALAGTQALPLTTHQALDQAVIAVLLGAALGLAIDGHPGATVVLGAAALLELALVTRTRWISR
jgi:hypothetical protein